MEACSFKNSDVSKAICCRWGLQDRILRKEFLVSVIAFGKKVLQCCLFCKREVFSALFVKVGLV